MLSRSWFIRPAREQMGEEGGREGNMGDSQASPPMKNTGYSRERREKKKQEDDRRRDLSYRVNATDNEEAISGPWVNKRAMSY